MVVENRSRLCFLFKNLFLILVVANQKTDFRFNIPGSCELFCYTDVRKKVFLTLFEATTAVSCFIIFIHKVRHKTMDGFQSGFSAFASLDGGGVASDPMLADMLDPTVLMKLSHLIEESDLLGERQLNPPIVDPIAVQDSSYTNYTIDPQVNTDTLASTTALRADETEVLQAKAESVVAMLDEAHELKANNPFRGQSFEELIQKISFDQGVKVYKRNVPEEKRVHGTVAEQILSVVDCENERHLYRNRQLRDDYERQLSALKESTTKEISRMRKELVEEKMLTEQEFTEKLDKSKECLKDQTEQIAREGLQSQLEGERAKDELSLANDDITALKKLLFFWKKKNNVIKQQFDAQERELSLAREKLKDYHQIHELDAYKVHRFCGQLREREMKSRWKSEELSKKVKELKIEIHNSAISTDHLKSSSSLEERLEAEFNSNQVAMQVNTQPDCNLLPSERFDPEDKIVYDNMKNDINKSRFELSKRCRKILGLDDNQEKGKIASRIASCFGKDQAAIAAEATALNDGIRLRDDQIDVLMSALQLRDYEVDNLRSEQEQQTQRIRDLEISKFQPFQCEDLVVEKDQLQRQLNDAKEIIYSIQKQIDDERIAMSEERKARVDRELSEAKERKEKELAQAEKLRERDTEIIRLRNRLQEGSQGLDSASEMRLVRLEQENNECSEKIISLEDEKSRLKQYVTSLSSRLEQSLSQLEHRNQKLKQYETLAATLALSPRNHETPGLPTSLSGYGNNWYVINFLCET